MLVDLGKIDFSSSTELCNIMNLNRSDKGNGHHNYTLVYHQLFSNFVEKEFNIFELGLGTNNIDVPSNMGVHGRPGASLCGWSDYFKNSNVYGADIDKRILFQTDRIKTFFCDQTSKESIENLWSNLSNIKFYLIIEDGLHTFEANINFLENSIEKVKDDGFYITEDIHIADIFRFKEYLRKSKLQIKEWQICNLCNQRNTEDNILLIIKK